MASFPISSEMLDLFSSTALPFPFLSDSKVLYSTGMSFVSPGWLSYISSPCDVRQMRQCGMAVLLTKES